MKHLTLETSSFVRRGLLALSPIAVFLLLYVVVSVVTGDFYKMPLSVAFIVAAMWAIVITRGKSLSERIDIFSKGAANPNILYMIWIFVMAGAFSALARTMGSVEATVNMTLTVLPPQWVLPGLFLVACFISMSIGTSVGTIVALTPFATQVAQTTSMSTALLVSVVLGGSFFGDNLSFISDTTIAATRSLRVKMNDKFKTNLWIAVPAAVIALAVYTVIGVSADNGVIAPAEAGPWWRIIPYLIVIATATIGLNVLVVLTLGIVSCLVIAISEGQPPLIDVCTVMGEGIAGMSDLIIVTLLAAGMLAVIKHNGGIDFLIKVLTKGVRGPRGALAAIAGLVGVVNLCTANNTIAIITVGDIARMISDRFKLDARRVASILDTGSCIVQCIIPYGAQTLLAAGIARLSPVSFLGMQYYAWALALMVALSIIFRFPRHKS